MSTNQFIRISLIHIFVFLFSQSSNCQKLIKNTYNTTQNISVELLGNGELYSLKYENILSKKKGFRYCIGFNYIPQYSKELEQHRITLSPELIYLNGRAVSKIEFGAGLNYMLAIDTIINNQNYKEIQNTIIHGFYANLRFGYRWEKGWNIFKIAFVPIFPFYIHGTNSSIKITKHYLPKFGISYGRKF